MSKIYYLARNEDAMRNGSFYRVQPRKRADLIAQYINGDFMGWVQAAPADLQRYDAKAAKALLPKR